MPSTRRIKVFGVLIFIAVISILFWSSSMRQRRDLDSQTDGDFYSKTVKGLDKKPVKPSVGEDEEVAKQMAQRLKEAAQLAKDNANAKAPKPDPPSSLVGVGNSAEGKNGVAGRKKFDSGNEQKVVKEETKEEHDIETELNSILKKSPSKSPQISTLLLVVGLWTKLIVYNSNNILQIILSAFKTSQEHLRKIYHRPRTLCRGTRPTSPGPRSPSSISGAHRQENSAQYTDQRCQYWRR